MFNVRLKTKLIERGISQIELAHELGIDDGYISNIIRGWRNPPDNLKRQIAERLDADVWWLFGTIKHQHLAFQLFVA